MEGGRSKKGRHVKQMISIFIRNVSLCLLGFHTMLPKSSGNCAGNISCWKWMQIGWNCKFAPQFDPLKVS